MQLDNYQQWQLQTRGNILLQGNVKYMPTGYVKIVGDCIFSQNGITVHQHKDGYTVANNNGAITLPYMPVFSVNRLEKLLIAYGVAITKEEAIEVENGVGEREQFNEWCERETELQMDNDYGY